MKNTKSLELTRWYLGKDIVVQIDRVLGSKHPTYDFVYPVNYGYVDGVIAQDGEELDAYVLEVSRPLKRIEGVCIAIVHRNDDDDDKLVVVPVEKTTLTDEEIMRQVSFQERWFDSVSIRK